MTVLVTTRPQFLNADTNVYTAWDLRSGDESAPGPGVADYESFRVMQNQAGASMNVDIGKTAVGLQRAWVRGSTRGGQGVYLVDSIDRTAPTADTYNAAQYRDTITANASGLPRLDQVVLEVLDAQHVGSSSLAQIRVVPGVGTAGADLDTRNGAAALPASCTLLADVIVANGAVSIVTANIQDRRALPLLGTAPPLLSSVDQVQFVPPPGVQLTNGACVSNASFDSFQAAALYYLPRRIRAATRIRWKYLQGGVANTGNYILSIYDASGRLIISTAATAYTGALNTFQVRSEAITATDFEAGYYYVHLGNAPATGTSTVLTYGTNLNVTTGPVLGPVAPNLGLHRASGGTTPPSRLGTTMIDTSTITVATILPVVPIVTLSVG